MQAKMSEQYIQKLKILCDSHSDFIDAARKHLTSEAEENGHEIVEFVVVDNFVSKTVSQAVITSWCVQCIFEMEITFGTNHLGDFTDVKVGSTLICDGRKLEKDDI